MSLHTPKLDDRTFQQLVDEAKKRIPHYTKEWTDHNVSDPGVTLIELFAWMTETILYRLNQVPDLHMIRFMELLGIRLLEPVPASAPVTFWLSAPQPNPVVIPAGTEVASTQTETKSSIIFTTNADLRISPPQLTQVVTRLTGSDGQKRYQEINVRRLAAGFEGVDVFTSTPQADDALYLGFENDLSHHLLGIDTDWDPAGGAGVDPTRPPWVWEAATGERDERWAACQVESDSTKGLNVAGGIQIHLPLMGKYNVNDRELYWVRVRVVTPGAAERQEGMRPYRLSPRLRRLAADAWGGTTSATHAQLVSGEFLGRSDGAPGQQFQLQRPPVLKRQPGEMLLVHVEGEPPQTWQEVVDLGDSGFTDRHYLLDGVTGELRLGPAVRQPDGTLKLYGAIPPRGANLIFQRYRTGGGTVGNVQAGILNTLKTAIPYVARVSNRQAAQGGLDAETLAEAMMRAPKLLRSRDRAVTEADFEFLAGQALPAAISRVKCLQPRPSEAGRVNPGLVYVLVIPRVSHPERYLSPPELELNEADVERLTQYLDARRLLTTRLSVRAPAYRWVTVRVQLRAAPGVAPSQVEAEVLSRLYRFLNPLTGGPGGQGWPFGRDLYVSDVYQCLQGVPDVQFIRGVEMRAARAGGDAEGEPVELLEVVAHGVIASARHQVAFV
ncbi:MAG: putative baseplate assembly protein [Candidatus Promineifilaceae bacterium]